MFPVSFFRLAVAASNAELEVTVTQLFSSLEFQDDVGTLDKLALLRDVLDRSNLILRPDLSKGDFDTERILCTRDNFVNEDRILKYIELGETAQQELKSSLLFDHKRYTAKPDTPIRELQSDGVIFSSLKTVAAFLNSGGGRLIVGAQDNWMVCGISDDYNFCEKRNIDSWELKFRDLIKTRFYDGDTVNNYITTTFSTIDRHEVCTATVAKRSRLSFLKADSGRYCLYIRQGNRSIELGIEQVEEFLVGRSRNKAPPT